MLDGTGSVVDRWEGVVELAGWLVCRHSRSLIITSVRSFDHLFISSSASFSSLTSSSSTTMIDRSNVVRSPNECMLPTQHLRADFAVFCFFHMFFCFFDDDGNTASSFRQRW